MACQTALPRVPSVPGALTYIYITRAESQGHLRRRYMCPRRANRMLAGLAAPRPRRRPCEPTPYIDCAAADVEPLLSRHAGRPAQGYRRVSYPPRSAALRVRRMHGAAASGELSRTQGAHILQVPPFLPVVEAVPHDELPAHLEAAVIDLEGHDAAARAVQEGTHPEAGRLAGG